MIYTNKRGIHPAFYNAIVSRQKNYNKGEADYSVTELLNSPRQVILQRRHYDELEIDASELLSSWEGHLIHDAIEMDTPRIIVNIDGTKVSGKADWIEPDSITDFKTTSVWGIIHGTNIKKWEEQLNCYSYLYFPEKDVKLYVEYYCTDWQKSKSIQDADYPPKQGRIEVRAWSKAEQLAFIRAKIRAVVASNDEIDYELPLCTSEEMWQRQDTWAVMREGQKKAVKLFDIEEIALEYIQLKDDGNMYLQYRPGERVKCENYCSQRKFCNQYEDYCYGKTKAD